MVKGFEFLHTREGFPSVVSSRPSNIEFDGLSDELVADYLVDQPFIVVGHPEIVEALAFSTREYHIVVGLEWP